MNEVHLVLFAMARRAIIVRAKPVSRTSPANGRSCAIMQYLCNKHEITKFYPKMPEQRAMIDSATLREMEEGPWGSAIRC